MTEAPRLYLASASPRRRELLQRLGRPCTILDARVDEESLQREYPGPREDLAEYLARRKALAAVAALASDEVETAWVLAADTTVLLDERVLGKPRDAAEAADMLLALRGRAHVVATGVALASPLLLSDPPSVTPPSVTPPSVTSASAGRAVNSRILRSLAVRTHVEMRAYSHHELDAYVRSGDPLDKAGAYAAQSESFQPVANIAGCFLSVVGLPLCAVAHLLQSAHVAIHPPRAELAHTPLVAACPWSTRCRPPLLER
ncbi:MAG TPA: Maf family protein [Ktedonobacterales bacterium]